MKTFKARVRYTDIVDFAVEAETEREAIQILLSGEGAERGRFAEDTEILLIEEVPEEKWKT